MYGLTADIVFYLKILIMTFSGLILLYITWLLILSVDFVYSMGLSTMSQKCINADDYDRFVIFKNHISDDIVLNNMLKESLQSSDQTDQQEADLEKMWRKCNHTISMLFIDFKAEFERQALYIKARVNETKPKGQCVAWSQVNTSITHVHYWDRGNSGQPVVPMKKNNISDNITRGETVI